MVTTEEVWDVFKRLSRRSRPGGEGDARARTRC